MKRDSFVLQQKKVLDLVGEQKSWTEEEKREKAAKLKEIFGYTKDEKTATAKQTRRKAIQAKVGPRPDESDARGIEEYNDRLQQARKELYTAEEYKELYGYDLSPESIRKFLQNAPQEAKTFFMSDAMSDEEKLKAMNTFRYNATTIDILDEQGNVVETMEKEDHTVPDDQLQPGSIEKDEAGNTFFSFAAIENDELVPTDADWEKMLKLMPAGDYAGKLARCKAGKQLHALLGGKLSGARSPGLSNLVGDYGFFQSRSVSNTNNVYALSSGNSKGRLSNYIRVNLRPVRRLATRIAA